MTGQASNSWFEKALSVDSQSASSSDGSDANSLSTKLNNETYQAPTTASSGNNSDDNWRAKWGVVAPIYNNVNDHQTDQPPQNNNTDSLPQWPLQGGVSPQNSDGKTQNGPVTYANMWANSLFGGSGAVSMTRVATWYYRDKIKQGAYDGNTPQQIAGKKLAEKYLADHGSYINIDAVAHEKWNKEDTALGEQLKAEAGKLEKTAKDSKVTLKEIEQRQAEIINYIQNPNVTKTPEWPDDKTIDLTAVRKFRQYLQDPPNKDWGFSNKADQNAWEAGFHQAKTAEDKLKNKVDEISKKIEKDYTTFSGKDPATLSTPEKDFLDNYKKVSDYIKNPAKSASRPTEKECLSVVGGPNQLSDVDAYKAGHKTLNDYRDKINEAEKTACEQEAAYKAAVKTVDKKLSSINEEIIECQKKTKIAKDNYDKKQTELDEIGNKLKDRQFDRFIKLKEKEKTIDDRIKANQKELGEVKTKISKPEYSKPEYKDKKDLLERIQAKLEKDIEADGKELKDVQKQLEKPSLENLGNKHKNLRGDEDFATHERDQAKSALTEAEKKQILLEREQRRYEECKVAIADKDSTKANEYSGILNEQDLKAIKAQNELKRLNEYDAHLKNSSEMRSAIDKLREKLNLTDEQHEFLKGYIKDRDKPPKDVRPLEALCKDLGLEKVPFADDSEVMKLLMTVEQHNFLALHINAPNASLDELCKALGLKKIPFDDKSASESEEKKIRELLDNREKKLNEERDRVRGREDDIKKAKEKREQDIRDEVRTQHIAKAKLKNTAEGKNVADDDIEVNEVEIDKEVKARLQGKDGGQSLLWKGGLKPWAMDFCSGLAAMGVVQIIDDKVDRVLHGSFKPHQSWRNEIDSVVVPLAFMFIPKSWGLGFRIAGTLGINCLAKETVGRLLDYEAPPDTNATWHDWLRPNGAEGFLTGAAWMYPLENDKARVLAVCGAWGLVHLINGLTSSGESSRSKQEFADSVMDKDKSERSYDSMSNAIKAYKDLGSKRESSLIYEEDLLRNAWLAFPGALQNNRAATAVHIAEGETRLEKGTVVAAGTGKPTGLINLFANNDDAYNHILQGKNIDLGGGAATQLVTAEDFLDRTEHMTEEQGAKNNAEIPGLDKTRKRIEDDLQIIYGKHDINDIFNTLKDDKAIAVDGWPSVKELRQFIARENDSHNKDNRYKAKLYRDLALFDLAFIAGKTEGDSKGGLGGSGYYTEVSNALNLARILDPNNADQEQLESIAVKYYVIIPNKIQQQYNAYNIFHLNTQ